MGSKRLGIREYARHRKSLGLAGASHVAVLAAIKTDRIQVDPKGRIDPARADKQWADNTQHAKARSGGRRRRRPPVSRDAQRAIRTELSLCPSCGQPPGGDGPGGDHELPARPTAAQATAVKLAYQARLAKLDYRKRIGELVEVEQVKARNYLVARNVRNQILALPDRLSALLAAEEDAQAVERILVAELRQVLTALSATPARAPSSMPGPVAADPMQGELEDDAEEMLALALRKGQPSRRAKGGDG